MASSAADRLPETASGRIEQGAGSHAKPTSADGTAAGWHAGAAGSDKICPVLPHSANAASTSTAANVPARDGVATTSSTAVHCSAACSGYAIARGHIGGGAGGGSAAHCWQHRHCNISRQTQRRQCAIEQGSCFVGSCRQYDRQWRRRRVAPGCCTCGHTCAHLCQHFVIAPASDH